MRTRCTSKCPSTPEPGYTAQTFKRRGSQVKVVIRNIPAAGCPICHEAFVSRATAHQIDRLLEPFHGKDDRIPSLPPAEVMIDFALAVSEIVR